MRYAPVVAVGRLVRAAAIARKPGGGSAVPGLVVNRLAPKYLTRTLSGFPDGLVVVSGSSGKSTTTKMLVAILRSHDLAVFTNPSTANIAQGLTSSLLQSADWKGDVPGDIAVLEMDEGHAAKLAPMLDPQVVVLTNVMVDQIDRFHDSEMVAQMLSVIASRASRAVVINGDDDFLARLADDVTVPISRFGVSEEVLARSPRGLGYTRTTPTRLAWGTIVTSVDGVAVTINAEGEKLDITIPAPGTHYAVDAATAIAAARVILKDRWDSARAIRALAQLEPVFARGERREVRGQMCDFVLVQNPASFQLNVDAIAGSADCIFFALGSDVRDPSYFWPVATAALGNVAVVSGAKPEEAALLLAYDGVNIDVVEPSLENAIERFFSLPTPPSGVKTFVFSADSMRKVRSILGLAGAK